MNARSSLPVLLLVLAACPPEPEPSDECNGEGDPSIILSDRQGDAELADGDTIEVFPPPQGGVFAELDVSVANLDVDELEFLRVTIDDVGSGQSLAVVRFFGDQVPWWCAESGLREVDNLPVGFDESLSLADIDGASVRVVAALETTSGEFASEYQVLLSATDY